MGFIYPVIPAFVRAEFILVRLKGATTLLAFLFGHNCFTQIALTINDLSVLLSCSGDYLLVVIVIRGVIAIRVNIYGAG